MKRKQLAIIMLLVSLLTVPSNPASAGHTFTRIIDDDCGPLNPLPPGALFFAEGPDIYWNRAYPVSNAHNQCYLWTKTLDGNQGGAPVNLAWWYMYSPSDPTGNYYVQAYQPGTHNSCGSVFYNVMPQGDTGEVFSRT